MAKYTHFPVGGINQTQNEVHNSGIIDATCKWTLWVLKSCALYLFKVKPPGELKYTQIIREPYQFKIKSSFFLEFRTVQILTAVLY